MIFISLLVYPCPCSSGSVSCDVGCLGCGSRKVGLRQRVHGRHKVRETDHNPCVSPRFDRTGPGVPVSLRLLLCKGDPRWEIRNTLKLAQRIEVTRSQRCRHSTSFIMDIPLLYCTGCISQIVLSKRRYKIMDPKVYFIV